MSYRNQYTHPKPLFKLSGSPEEQIAQLKKEVQDLHESVGKNLTREFEAIRVSGGGTTVINRTSVSGGGGGSTPSSAQSLHVEQTVSVAGTITVNFVDVGTANYGVMAYILKSNGDYSTAYPNVPPRSDSRTTNSITVDAQEIGSLHTFIILD